MDPTQKQRYKDISMVNEFAVYSEYSSHTTSISPGANVRVFNHIDNEQGDSIKLSQDTGVINLKKGLYHITASATSCFEQVNATPFVKDNNEAHCQLSYAAGEQGKEPICVGNLVAADMTPSLIDTYLKVEDSASIVLEYKNGTQEAEVVSTNDNASGLRIFSRISILKMAHPTSSPV